MFVLRDEVTRPYPTIYKTLALYTKSLSNCVYRSFYRPHDRMRSKIQLNTSDVSPTNQTATASTRINGMAFACFPFKGNIYCTIKHRQHNQILKIPNKIGKHILKKFICFFLPVNTH